MPPGSLSSGYRRWPPGFGSASDSTAGWTSRCFENSFLCCCLFRASRCSCDEQPRLIPEIDWRLRGAIHFEFEDIRPRIMPCNVKRPARARRGFALDLAVENSLFAPERAGRDLAGWLHDHRVAVAKPVLVVDDALPLREIRRQVLALQRGAGADDPATAFLGDVLHGRDPLLAAVPGRR